MNKYIISTALMCMLVACNTLDNPSSETTDTVIYIEANSEDGITKGSVDGSGVSAPFTWNTGDQIAVYADGYKISDLLAKDYNNLSEVSFGFGTVGSNALVQSNRANFAIFPISLVYDGFGNLYTEDVTATSLKLNLPASYSLSQVQNDVSPTPMIATNAPNGNLAFKALCPLLRITVVNIPKQTKSIEFDFNGQKVQGEFTLTSVEAGTTAIATTPTAGTDDIITVTMAGNTTWHDNLVINLPVPAGTYGNITITAKDEAGLPVLTLTKAIKAAGWAPTRKSSRKMTATLPVFSVADGKYVTIAPGNLQAVFTEAGSSCTWKFADHQYDLIGNAIANNAVIHGGVSEAGTVDLFGFVGSNSEFVGLAQYGISNSMTNADYRTAGNVLKSDWGNLVISGYAANTWRTPAGGDPGSEWTYLFNTRTDAATKYGHATVGGNYGLIVLPDSFVDPMKNNGSGLFLAGNRNYTDNVYTSGGDWEAMEAAGAIFLPSGGYRNGVSVGRPNEYGCYLTTGCSTISNFCMRVSSNDIKANIEDDYFSGQSVRLIRDLN